MATHGKSLKQLRADLRHETDIERHLNAKKALQQILGEAGLASELAAALDSEHAAVRYNAASGLRDLGPAAAPQAQRLAVALRDADGCVRSTAAYALGSMGSAAMPHIVELLSLALRGDEALDSRHAAAGALRELNVKDMHDVLGDAPALPSSTALGAAAAPHAAKLAVRMRESDGAVRQAAAYALRSLGPPAEPYAREIAAAMEDHGADLRNVDDKWRQDSDVFALGPPQGSVGGHHHAAQLAAVLRKSTDRLARQTAASGLRSAGVSAAPFAKDLAHALKDTDVLVRQTVAFALGGLGKAAIPFAKDLAAAMSDQDEDVRSAAVGAVFELGLGDELLAS